MHSAIHPLKSDGIYLRALEPDDLDFLFEIENDPANWLISSTVAPFSRDVLRQYLDNAHLDIYSTRQLRLVICLDDNTAIGTIDLYDFEPLHLRAGVGIIVKEEFRRQQAAAKALALLENYCKTVLHLHQLFCTIQSTNGGSLLLFSKAGYTRTGTRREWLKTADGWSDAVEMQKILQGCE